MPEWSAEAFAGMPSAAGLEERTELVAGGKGDLRKCDSFFLCISRTSGKADGAMFLGRFSAFEIGAAPAREGEAVVE